MKGNFLMNRPLLSIIIISCLLLNGCEDNETNNNQTGEEVITHDIDAIGASGFYFNLSSGTEVDSSSTWHVSFQMIPVEFGDATYMMPSLILGETTYTAEYTDISVKSYLIIDAQIIYNITPSYRVIFGTKNIGNHTNLAYGPYIGRTAYVELNTNYER